MLGQRRRRSPSIEPTLGLLVGVCWDLPGSADESLVGPTSAIRCAQSVGPIA